MHLLKMPFRPDWSIKVIVLKPLTGRATALEQISPNNNFRMVISELIEIMEQV